MHPITYTFKSFKSLSSSSKPQHEHLSPISMYQSQNSGSSYSEII